MQWDDDIVQELVAITGIAADQIRKSMTAVASNARHEAIESLSDDDVPQTVSVVAMMASQDTGERITAIKRSQCTLWRPVGGQDCPDGWQQRRLTGGLTATDPAPEQVTREWWYYIVDGNPIRVEAWLQCHGWRALADGPSTCRAIPCDHLQADPRYGADMREMYRSLREDSDAH